MINAVECIDAISRCLCVLVKVAGWDNVDGQNRESILVERKSSSLYWNLSSIQFDDNFLQTTTRNAWSVGDLSKSSQFISFSLFAMGLMVDLPHALPISCLAIPHSRGNVVFRPRLICFQTVHAPSHRPIIWTRGIPTVFYRYFWFSRSIIISQIPPPFSPFRALNS